MHYRLADTIPEALEAELGHYSPFLRQLLFTRGIDSKEKAEAFLQPSYEEHLHDPFLMHQMSEAVERILQAIKAQEKIVVYSDYDCDGIPGGVVLHDFLTAVGHENFFNHIPHRHYDGFGLNVAAVEKFSGEDVDLIITIDCGSTDVEAVATAKERGIDVIITDHHQPKETLPEAVALVNPQIGDSYPFKGLCGAGVIYKVIQALLQRGDFDLTPGWEKWWLDMVGIATVADMVPLRDENRALAFYGLQVLRKSRRPGLQALLRKQRASQAHLTEDDIGFTIGPRINASSRMDNPEYAFAMLSETDESKAGAHVDLLEKLNNERKGQVAAMTKEVHKKMESYTEIPGVLVLGNPEWRPSLVGLTANKLAEEFRRPAFVWGRDGNGKIKGSARSDGRVSVLAIMQQVADSLSEFGGHHMAGGFGVKEDSIHTLAEAMAAARSELGSGAEVDTTVVADCALTLEAITPTLLREQSLLAPFGMENDKPTYVIENVVPTSVSIFGKTKEHTKLTFDTSGAVKEAIAFFRLPEHFTKEPESLVSCTVLGQLEQSFFMGRLQNRLRIVDIV